MNCNAFDSIGTAGFAHCIVQHGLRQPYSRQCGTMDMLLGALRAGASFGGVATWRLVRWGLGVLVLGAALSACKRSARRVLTEEFLPITTPRPDRLPVFPPKWCAPPWPRPNCKATFSPCPGRGPATAQSDPDVPIYLDWSYRAAREVVQMGGRDCTNTVLPVLPPQRNLKLQRLEDAKEYQIATVNEDVGSST